MVFGLSRMHHQGMSFGTVVMVLVLGWNVNFLSSCVQRWLAARWPGDP
jgi:uncharacterized membrane protein YczE